MPALIFDCDGVLADTERDGHLPAFNAAFAEFGLPIEWDADTYHRKLQIGGGKERIASEFTGPQPMVEPVETADLIRQLHARKTELFTERVDAGLLPGRPGIHRLIAAVLDLGWTVAVASTSAERSVRAVLEHAVGPELAARCHVFAGDIVAHKKPAPDIYLKVLTDLGLDPAESLVVEDSAIGLRAARAAGLTTIVTISSFTAGEDFTGAALVVSHLGDPDNPLEVVAAPADVRPVGMVTVSDLEDLSATNQEGAT
jgi:HAD superfamily hydrolase (TIGR01509 family)